MVTVMIKTMVMVRVRVMVIKLKRLMSNYLRVVRLPWLHIPSLADGWKKLDKSRGDINQDEYIIILSEYHSHESSFMVIIKSQGDLLLDLDQVGGGMKLTRWGRG